ncbi:MAG: hypothetical protein RLZZ360_516 [Candidatus Parcubacteria bacterium]|jgi:hypothetical protein
MFPASNSCDISHELEAGIFYIATSSNIEAVVFALKGRGCLVRG